VTPLSRIFIGSLLPERDALATAHNNSRRP
jgi:hypothetical protein